MKNKIIIIAVLLFTLFGCNSNISGPLVVDKIELNNDGDHSAYRYKITFIGCHGTSNAYYFTNELKHVGDTLK